jgi:DNA repair protein RadC
MPSDDAKRLTEVIKNACRILNITLTDHIILTETGSYSFSENGIL